MLAAAAAEAVCAVGAATADASFLAYECAGFNLCAANPDGSGQHAQTTDGSDASRYVGRSLSADETRMSWLHGSGLYVGDPNAIEAAPS
jgi:hypothetical protein